MCKPPPHALRRKHLGHVTLWIDLRRAFRDLSLSIRSLLARLCKEGQSLVTPSGQFSMARDAECGGPTRHRASLAARM